MLPTRLSKCIIIHSFLLQMCIEPEQVLTSSQAIVGSRGDSNAGLALRWRRVMGQGGVLALSAQSTALDPSGEAGGWLWPGSLMHQLSPGPQLWPSRFPVVSSSLGSCS